ncbi:uncharacterized protein J8A68_003723 [[Candida] subhashii]|uniref:Reverse transcriptase RNase H-like domain-containing protein n=1 Tax=[Candida] subhashii TaxID=561895 RepID=A0A8J5UW55_9ASCO|nr:uncharacterized protein J8A68_003723 [[Candida] subhashii]KAG7662735.1 hypothetical protein J8A68_003723 [[Candida] subhashii]
MVTIHTDASNDSGIFADSKGVSRIVPCHSGKFQGSTFNYSIFQKELFAIHNTLQANYPLTSYTDVICIFCDNKALVDACVISDTLTRCRNPETVQASSYAVKEALMEFGSHFMADVESHSSKIRIRITTWYFQCSAISFNKVGLTDGKLVKLEMNGYFTRPVISNDSGIGEILIVIHNDRGHMKYVDDM